MSLEIITLTDIRSGAQAKILPGFGFNCYSFQTRHGGQTLETLWSAPEFETGNGRASSSGIPLLFPFPGRIGGGEFHFEGKKYKLEAGDGRGNAIHGFVIKAPWQVVEQSESRVVGRFRAWSVEPAILDLWPSDFELTVAYAVDGNALLGDFTVANPGPGRLPFGLGTHPYFRVPLGTLGKAAQCRVTVPASESWELADMLPTGRKVSSDIHAQLRAGMEFGQTQFDDVFTGLSFAAGQATAAIQDPANGRTIRIGWDENFRECVVYNPPHRQAICLEPYTCCPDPFRLTEQGLDAGLRILEPGETFRAKIDIRVD